MVPNHVYFEQEINTNGKDEELKTEENRFWNRKHEISDKKDLSQRKWRLSGRESTILKNIQQHLLTRGLDFL